MTTTVRDDLLAAGLTVFERDGFEGATVAAIRNLARASNGSFFHFFGSKKELAGTLFLEILQRYHASVVAALDPQPGAREGIARLIRAHLIGSSTTAARRAFCSRFRGPNGARRCAPPSATRTRGWPIVSSAGARRWLPAANCFR